MVVVLSGSGHVRKVEEEEEEEKHPQNLIQTLVSTQKFTKASHGQNNRASRQKLQQWALHSLNRNPAFFFFFFPLISDLLERAFVRARTHTRRGLNGKADANLIGHWRAALIWRDSVKDLKRHRLQSWLRKKQSKREKLHLRLVKVEKCHVFYRPFAQTSESLQVASQVG